MVLLLYKTIHYHHADECFWISGQICQLFQIKNKSPSLLYILYKPPKIWSQIKGKLVDFYEKVGVQFLYSVGGLGAGWVYFSQSLQEH